MAKTIKELFPRQPKLYDCNAVKNLIFKYVDNGGTFNQIEDGCLGWGHIVCYGENLKTCVIKEIAVNSQYSAHTIRFYNTCPKKYEQYCI